MSGDRKKIIIVISIIAILIIIGIGVIARNYCI